MSRAGALPLAARLVRPLDHPAHEPGRLGDVRVGPRALGRVDLAVRADAGQLVRDGVAVLLGHEVRRRRERGRDHGLAERHALREREAEALAAVQRHVAVAARDERVALARAQRAIDDVHVRPAARRPQHLLERLGTVHAVDRLDHELRPLAGLERAAGTRSIRPDRVLALDRAEEVEHEQEPEAVRHAEVELDVARVGSATPAAARVAPGSAPRARGSRRRSWSRPRSRPAGRTRPPSAPGRGRSPRPRRRSPAARGRSPRRPTRRSAGSSSALMQIRLKPG